jgi:transposase, IS30 family
MKYRRVTHEDRLGIKAFLDAGLNQSEIADKLGFNKSTLSREMRRNRGGRGYRPKQAQKLAEERQEYRLRPRKMLPEMIRRIEAKLRLKWSPEQISNRFRVEGQSTVATETIYRYVYSDRGRGGELWKHLRWSRRQRKRRFPSEERRGKIQNATPISERPMQANRREKRGHWERDTMIGKNRKTAILALVDRKSRFNRFAKLNRRLAPGVTNKTIQLLKGLPCRSITNDRGQEFADHACLSKKLKVPIYFCDPYSSYQRGTNENRIGILRQYFPKKTDLSNLHWKTLRKVELEINNRPMKILDWKTPYEAMMGKSCAAVV